MVTRCNATKVSRAVKAAAMFSSGNSKRPYVVRKEILWGMAKLKNRKSRGVSNETKSSTKFEIWV